MAQSPQNTKKKVWERHTHTHTHTHIHAEGMELNGKQIVQDNYTHYNTGH